MNAIVCTPVGALLMLQAEYLQNDRFALLTDSQDIAAVCESIGIKPDNVSGILADARDGDYCEVWTCRFRRPFEFSAVYERVL